MALLAICSLPVSLSQLCFHWGRSLKCFGDSLVPGPVGSPFPTTYHSQTRGLLTLGFFILRSLLYPSERTPDFSGLFSLLDGGERGGLSPILLA